MEHIKRIFEEVQNTNNQFKRIEKRLYENEEIVGNIELGDYVDFGDYGKLYVIKIYGNKGYVTDVKEHRYIETAPSWSINLNFAKEIIEKGDQTSTDIEANQDEKEPIQNEPNDASKKKVLFDRDISESKKRKISESLENDIFDVKVENKDIDGIYAKDLYTHFKDKFSELNSKIQNVNIEDIDVENMSATIKWKLDVEARSWGVKSIYTVIKELKLYIDYKYIDEENPFESTIELDGEDFNIDTELYGKIQDGVKVTNITVNIPKKKITVEF